MNGVRILHLDYGLPNPLENNFAYANLMRGIRRCLGDRTNRKLPMTPKLLANCLSYMNLDNLHDISTWAIMLLAFYGMLRMGSIVCQDNRCDHSKHMSLQDISPSPSGFIVVIRFTKTIQFQQRQLIITLPRITGSPLCPSQALALYLMKRPRGVPRGPLFMRDIAGSPVTTASIRARIQQLLQLAGFAPAEFGNHSMRRGGATFAYSMDIDLETIRVVGDWSNNSNSWKLYVTPSQQRVAEALSKMACGAHAELS